MVGGKVKGESLKTKGYLGLIILVLALVLINVLAQFAYTRFDFTKEKRFTLTEKTKETLKNNNHEVVVRVYLDGDMPAAFKRLRNATKDLLTDYKAYSNTNFKFIFVDPLSGKSAQEQESAINELYGVGVTPTNVNIKTDAGFAEKLVFPTLLVSYGISIKVNFFKYAS